MPPHLDPLIRQAASQFSTPLFIYDADIFLHNASAYQDQNASVLTAYALKANNNLHILRQLAKFGLGADVTSGGELFLALKAGFSPQKIIFSGVGKQQDEIQMAISAGIKALHVESEMEWAVIAEVASQTQKKVPIGVRVNPDILAETHPYISTGQANSKFGVSPQTAVSLYHRTAQHRWLKPVGVAAHIGSQIQTNEAHIKTAVFLTQFAQRLAADGIQLRYVDVGGGLGIDYKTAEPHPPISAWVTAVSKPVLDAGYHLVMEPGRSIIGPAGTLLTRVLYIKTMANKQMVIVDAAMNDLLRPTLYQAEHPIRPVGQGGGATINTDIVGPVCESGDWLAKNIQLPPLQPGDLLAIQQAGAYGFAMGSNYNGRLRPAEVLVENGRLKLIRRRQQYADLLPNL